MKKTPLKYLVLWVLLQFSITSMLVGCDRPSDGSRGVAGLPGATGTPGTNGTSGGDGMYLPDDLTFTITSASVGATTATLFFTATEVSTGRPFNRLSQLDVTHGYLLFFLGQLAPPASTGETPQWKNYKNSAVGGVTLGANPTYDTTGTLALTDGTNAIYSYTFSYNPKTVTTPVAVTYNANYTHRVALQTAYPGREIVAGTANIIKKSSTLDFVPSGHAVDGITTVTKLVAATVSCNQCHDEMSGHEEKYKDVNVCVLCHNATTKLGDSVNYDMNYMIHAMHSFAGTPTVAGTPNSAYSPRIVPWRGPLNTGFVGTATEEIGLPQSSGNCRKCHHAETLTNGEVATGADGDIWKNSPTMNSCTACHDRVVFSTASTHKNWKTPGVVNGGVQTTNQNCSVCHYSSMIEAYHSTSAGGTPHKPNTSVGTWEKGTITYPQLSYEITSATMVGSDLSIDFAVKADGVVIDLLDATGTGNNKRFATSYSVPSVKKSAATADAPYTKYVLPTVPSFYLAFAADQGSITAANAVDWNNIGNGNEKGAGQPLTVSLLRLGMKYWAQPYDGAATPVTGALVQVPCTGDVRQIAAGCDAAGASGAPGTVTGENVNLGTLTPRYSGPTLIGFTAVITSQTVTALNSAYKSSGLYGTTLPRTVQQVYPYPVGAKLRAVGLGGYFKWDTQATPYAAGTPSGTLYTGNLASLYAQSLVKGVAGDTDRRNVVDAAKCANCHEQLAMHGGNRVYEPKICSMCHNAALSTPGKTLDTDNPVDSLQLKNFLHGVHGAEKRETPLYFAAGTTVYAYTSNTWLTSLLTDFDTTLNASNNGVLWSKDMTAGTPVALAKTVTLMSFPGKPQNCLTCHIDSTSTADATYGIEAIPAKALESTKDIAESIAALVDPVFGGGTGTLTTTRDSNYKGRQTFPHDADITTKAISASCMGCHDSAVAKVHMDQNGGKVDAARNATPVSSVETCVLCHGYGRVVDADVKHGVKSAKHP